MSENERLKLKGLNLLYVEDNKRLIDEINSLFDMVFNQVYTAHDGLEALDILESKKIDIIITDLNMPNMDGIKFIKEVREKSKEISIIILTAHADKNLLLEASNLQIDGYLTKPMNFEKIFSALSNALQRIKTHTFYTFKNGVTYDVNSKVIENKGMTKVELGKKESQLLEYLILNANSVVSKEKIIYHIWDLNDVTDSALKNLLSNLRNKLGKENIINQPGLGWKILLQENKIEAHS